MQEIARELDSFIEQNIEALRNVHENVMSLKPSPAKWSKKEIMGHLVDSAQSNIWRFIVGQYEDTPHITYNQDKWVAISAYQEWDTAILIELWYGMNKQAAAVLFNISSENAQRTVQTEALHTIEWLAQDYLKHLRHHVHQVLDIDPVAYP